MTVGELRQKLEDECMDHWEVKLGPANVAKPILDLLHYDYSEMIVLSPNPPLTKEQLFNAFLDAA